MKTLNWICAFSAAALLSGCVYETIDSRPPHHHRPTPPGNGQMDSRYYRDGYSRGTEDARRGDRKQASRYWGDVPRQFRDEFSRGYSDGFDRVGRPGPVTPARDHFLAGVSAGERDRRRGLSYEPARDWGSVPPRFREDYSRGYAEGFGPRRGRR